MTLLLSIFADDIIPVLLIASVGFLLARRLHADVRPFSALTLNVLMPCLVFTALLSTKVSAVEFGRTVLFATAATFEMAAAGWLVARVLRLDRATGSGFVLGVTFANVANYGLPVVLFAFGQALFRTVFYLPSVVSGIAVALHEMGVLEKYGVELIGAKFEAIRKAEDRNEFRQAMEKLGLVVPRSGYIRSVEEALEVIAAEAGRDGPRQLEVLDALGRVQLGLGDLGGAARSFGDGARLVECGERDRHPQQERRELDRAQPHDLQPLGRAPEVARARRVE